MKTAALPALRVTVRALPALLTMVAAFPFSLVAGTDSGRIWSNTDGRTLHAEFVSQQDGIVRLRRIEDGREYPVAIDHLSIQDRQYLEQDGPHIDRIRATNKPTRPDFVQLRDYAMSGNTYAVDALNELAEKLYEGLNPERDREKWLSNLTLMRSIFTPWGLAAGAGNDRAFDTLVLAANYSRIRSFVPDALGQGAAKGGGGRGQT